MSLWEIDRQLRKVAICPRYVQIAGDLVTGAVLCQIVYWFRPNDQGQRKVSIPREGRCWLAKSRDALADECSISPKQCGRAISVLRGLDLIDVRVWKFGGTPMNHFWLNEKRLLALLDAQKGKSECPDKPNPSYPKGKVQHVEKYVSSTEITAETTVEITLNADAIHKSSKTTQGKPQGEGKSALIVLWKEKLALHSPPVVTLTGKEVGQLNRLYQVLGEQALPVLKFMLDNWPAFAEETRYAAGLEYVPFEPATWMVCKHYQVALAMMAPKPVKKLTILEPMPAIPKPPEEPKPTAADIQASLDAIYGTTTATKS